MKIVIVGAGKIGLTLAEHLSTEGNDVTLIDTDPKIIKEAVDSCDVIGIVGNGVSFSVQRDAGVNHADIVIATTYSDEINMLTCLVAMKVGVRHTIARIRDPEYSQQFIYMLDEMGLDMVVNPELESAREISRLIRYPSVIGLDTFAKGRVDLAEMIIPKGSLLDGVSLKDLPKLLSVRILVCAVARGDQVFIPRGDHVLQAGDRIHFTASHNHLAVFFRKLGLSHQKLKSVFIIGGGRIAYYLAKHLIELGLSVKIVEMDAKRCAELSELLPHATILHGDGTDQTLLGEENFKETDACVAATGIDEENIIISLYAMCQGVDKVITKISKSTLTSMLGMVGLDSVISPKQITANLILSYIRAMQASSSGGIQTLYQIVDNKAEAVEFFVAPKSRVSNIPLKDLNLKPNLLICCIIRSNQVLFPGGEDMLLEGDKVIVTTVDEQLVNLDDILK